MNLVLMVLAAMLLSQDVANGNNGWAVIDAIIVFYAVARTFKLSIKVG